MTEICKYCGAEVKTVLRRGRLVCEFCDAPIENGKVQQKTGKVEQPLEVDFYDLREVDPYEQAISLAIKEDFEGETWVFDFKQNDISIWPYLIRVFILSLVTFVIGCILSVVWS
jgi:hypothetical protein